MRDAVGVMLDAQGDLSVVASTGDFSEALQMARTMRPDVSIVDLPDRANGFEKVRHLADIPTAVVLLAAAIEKGRAVAASRWGARGIVLKSAPADVLCRCIRAVSSGHYWVGGHALPNLGQTLRVLRALEDGADPRRFGLTPRELEIVAAVVAGETNRMIADRLSLSQDTVKHHLTHVFDKLGVFTRLELALFAIHHRLIAEPARELSGT
jgi:two-component system, NarL family, nitrate/nitrite response regulator NarL